jgi:nicotinamidase-related amidase
MTKLDPQRETTALFLIDFQRDFLTPDGKLPVAQYQVGPVIEAAARAKDLFLASGQPIVAIGNEFWRWDVLNIFRRFASIAGSLGSKWDERLSIEGTPYFPKKGGSAFGNPALEPWLRERGVTALVLTGLQAKACVTATAKSALKKGFKVSTLDEAVACLTGQSKARALRKLHSMGVISASFDSLSASM